MHTFLKRLLAAWLALGFGGPARAELTSAEKGRVGELRMDQFVTGARGSGGLDMRRLFDPARSKIAGGGEAGGTGFDGVYVYLDSKSGTYRYLIGEAKFGSSQLGEFEFDLLDVQGNPTGKKGRYFQGSKEWVAAVLDRMRRQGNDYDREVAAALAAPFEEGRLDFLLFQVPGEGAKKGSWEMGPIEAGATTPRGAYRGKKGAWRLEQDVPRMDKMIFGQVGCSACELGSRFYEAAVKRKLQDPASAYSSLDAPDENVNAFYLVPESEALGQDFRRERANALAEADVVEDALSHVPEQGRARARQKVAGRADQHFELETKKSLIDRQRFWQGELTPAGRLKVQRTRSLVDELKGDSKGLKVLQRAMLAGALAQLAWTYYEGGEQALLTAMGQMVLDEVREEARDYLWIWALQSLAARGILSSGVAETLVPMIESGGLAAVLTAADLGFNVGYAVSESYLYGELYDAESFRITGDLLRVLRESDFKDRRPPVTFASLCDPDVFPARAALSARIQKFIADHHYTEYPSSVLQQFEGRMQMSWMVCKARDVSSRFYELPGELTRANFCKTIDTPEKVQARLGHVRTLVDPGGQLAQADWDALTKPVLDQYAACRMSLPVRTGLSAPIRAAEAEDLLRLDEKPGEAPQPTALLLTSGEEETLEVEKGGTLRLRTQALVLGLPGVETALRLRGEIQDALGQRRQLGQREQSFSFAKDAYEPADLVRTLDLEDALEIDEKLAAGPSTYTAQMYRGAELLETRSVRLVPKERKLRESIVVLLDASGSMRDDHKMDQARTSAGQVLAGLGPDTEVALIVFYDCGNIVVEQEFTTDPSVIAAKLPGIQPRGSTPLAEALAFAKRHLGDKAVGASGRLVVLTDGLETCGGDPVAAAREE
jgi:Mg-chelatase subunit ChlD